MFSAKKRTSHSIIKVDSVQLSSADHSNVDYHCCVLTALIGMQPKDVVPQSTKKKQLLSSSLPLESNHFPLGSEAHVQSMSTSAPSHLTSANETITQSKVTVMTSSNPSQKQNLSTVSSVYL